LVKGVLKKTQASENAIFSGVAKSRGKRKLVKEERVDTPLPTPALMILPLLQREIRRSRPLTQKVIVNTCNTMNPSFI